MRNSRIALLVFYSVLIIGIFIFSIFSPVFRAASYAPLRELILPQPEPIELKVFYSAEKDGWLEEAVVLFTENDYRVNGHPIELVLVVMDSREMYLSILDGAQPDVISPASSIQIGLLESLSETKFGNAVVDPDSHVDCRSVVTTPIVLVSWQERADVLWENVTEDDFWKHLQFGTVNPKGWGEYDHPEWGYIKFVHTNPLLSTSGILTITSMTYEYFDFTSGLREDDILANDDFQKWLLDFENSVVDFGESADSLMRDFIVYGPSMYDTAAVYESTVINYLGNSVDRYGKFMVYYPPKTIMSDHPFCVLKADWVTGEKYEAAQYLLNFLESEEAQQIAMMDYGFRPVDTSIELDQSDSPFVFYQGRGIKRNIPESIELPSVGVLQTLLDFWDRNVMP